MERIDCHMHLHLNGFTAQRIIDYLDSNKLDQCWLLTWEEDTPAQANYNNLSIEDVYEAYKKYPSRIIPMYAPDPSRASAGNELIDWYMKGIRGIAELKVRQNWNSPMINNILEIASRFKLPILFHMAEGKIIYRSITNQTIEKNFCRALSTERYKKLPGRLARSFSRVIPPFRHYLEKTCFKLNGYMVDFVSLEQRLDQYPDVIFIGHGPLFWKGISKELGMVTYPKGRVKEEGVISRLLSEKDNLYADLSGGSGYNALSRDLVHTKRFLSKNSYKVLFGTDNTSINRLLTLLDALQLSRQQYNNIMGGNAVSILGKMEL